MENSIQISEKIYKTLYEIWLNNGGLAFFLKLDLTEEEEKEMFHEDLVKLIAFYNLEEKKVLNLSEELTIQQFFHDYNYLRLTQPKTKKFADKIVDAANELGIVIEFIPKEKPNSTNFVNDKKTTPTKKVAYV